MTLREALAEGISILISPCPSALIDTPALDASLLLADTMQITRTELVVRGNEAIAERDLQKFRNLLERRRNGECIAYILGRKEFRGLEFAVNPHVLVPRPETETLAEAALEYLDSAAEKGTRGLSLLDLCTGSGALAISLANERPDVSVTASDISAGALEIAALNAARLLGPAEEPARFIQGIRFIKSVRFIKSDLFENIPDKFNIIVSNPPYVPSCELPALAPEVQREPGLALDGGEDGLFLIRKIISRSPEHLLPGGVLLLEAGPGQMAEIKTLLENHNFDSVNIRRDLAGRERVISAEKSFQDKRVL